MNQEFIPAMNDEDQDILQLPEEVEDRLDFTQRIRAKIVSKVTNGGRYVPTDAEGAGLLLETLKQMDSTSLGTLRVKVDSNKNSSDELVKQAILAMQRNPELSIADNTAVDNGNTTSQPSLSDIQIDLVPDQTHIGVQNLNYGDFKETFDK